MRRDPARLLVRYLLLAAAVVLLNFLIPRLLPGDPLDPGGAEGMTAATPLPAETRARIADYYGLNEPLGRQLIGYLGDLARGDLGWSIAQPAPVSRLILERLPWTLALMLTALALSTLLGTALGLLAGWRAGRALDRVLVSLSGALSAIPEFLIGIGLLAVFSVGLGWFPLMGGRTVFAAYGDGAGATVQRLADAAWHLALPATALALAGVAGFLLLARDTTAGLRSESWLTVAHAKGLPVRQIVLRHALPNLALPLLTFFSLRLGAVLGGALVVERVFGVPGLGLLAFQAVRARDYPVLQAEFLLASLGVLLANLLAELAYLRLDPRRGAGHG